MKPEDIANKVFSDKTMEVSVAEKSRNDFEKSTENLGELIRSTGLDLDNILELSITIKGIEHDPTVEGTMIMKNCSTI